MTTHNKGSIGHTAYNQDSEYIAMVTMQSIQKQTAKTNKKNVFAYLGLQKAD